MANYDLAAMVATLRRHHYKHSEYILEAAQRYAE